MNNTGNILRGTIIDVNSKEYVCHVKVFDPSTNTGYTVENVPFLSRSLTMNTWSGEVSIPERMTTCLVVEINKQHFILDILPTKHVMSDTVVPTDKNTSLSHSSSEYYTPSFTDKLRKPEDVKTRKFIEGSRANRPHDALPGDKFWRTREGAFLGVLRGGVVIAKAHEFCQFILNRVDALCRIITRNMQVFTDCGRIDILNDKGSTNIALKVGSQYADNKSEEFTVELNVGAVGDLVTLSIKGAGGTELSSVRAYPTGRLIAKMGMSEVDINDDTHVYIKSEGNLYLN